LLKAFSRSAVCLLGACGSVRCEWQTEQLITAWQSEKVKNSLSFIGIGAVSPKIFVWTLCFDVKKTIY